MPDEDLAVARGARADPDRRDAEAARDERGDSVRNRLEDDREAARVLQPEGVVEDAPRGLGGGGLDAVAAERADGLRREAEVAHDGNAGLDDRADGPRTLAPALELHGVHAPVGEEPSGVADGLGDVGLVREERHVADAEGAPCVRARRRARGGACRPS